MKVQGHSQQGRTQCKQNRTAHIIDCSWSGFAFALLHLDSQCVNSWSKGKRKSKEYTRKRKISIFLAHVSVLASPWFTFLLHFICICACISRSSVKLGSSLRRFYCWHYVPPLYGGSVTTELSHLKVYREKILTGIPCRWFARDYTHDLWSMFKDCLQL